MERGGARRSGARRGEAGRGGVRRGEARRLLAVTHASCNLGTKEKNNSTVYCGISGVITF